MTPKIKRIAKVGTFPGEPITIVKGRIKRGSRITFKRWNGEIAEGIITDLKFIGPGPELVMIDLF